MTTNQLRIPKQKELTENEDVTSYSKWQSNMLFHLSQFNEFAPFLDTEWGKHGTTNRNLQNDAETVAANERKTAVQKKIVLERMIGLVAQHAPPLLHKEITNRSTSLAWIWKRIRRHYGFSQSEVHFLNLHTIRKNPDERYETFYQRIVCHLEDNLLTTSSNIQHDGEDITEDETMSPTTERLAVYLWLTLIDARLPPYVQRVFAHDLQTKSLKDIQPVLSQSMDSLLAELSAQEDIQVQYASSSYNNRNRSKRRTGGNRVTFQDNAAKICSLCKAAGRLAKGHDISTCWNLSKAEKLQIAKALQVIVDESSGFEDELEDVMRTVVIEPPQDGEEESDCLSGQCSPSIVTTTTVNRVECDSSPFFYAFYLHHACHIVVDSGATSSMISRSFLIAAGIIPRPTLHGARGADKNRLEVQGEISITLTFNGMDLPLTALVLDNLDCDVLAGNPFCKAGDIHIHFRSETMTIQNHKIAYGTKSRPPAPSVSSIKYAESFIVQNDSEKVLLPGEFVEIQSHDLQRFEGQEVSVEPRTESPQHGRWPERSLTRVIQGTVRIPNLSNEPVHIAKSQHIAQIRRVITPSLIEEVMDNPSVLSDDPISSSNTTSTSLSVPNEECINLVSNVRQTCNTEQTSNTEHTDNTEQQDSSLFHSARISVDPDGQLSVADRQSFIQINQQFDSVFAPTIGLYNDNSGPLRAHVHMGPVEPPPRKGKLPLYSNNNMQLLQAVADKLEKQGVLAKPEDLGIKVKFVSPSFLVRKPDGDYRFVTAFNNLGMYTRILPTASMSCDTVLRRLSSFKYLIKTDFTKSFFQIRLSKSSMPYVGTPTPFKGLRVYTRPAMGMPGSSEYLQELTSRVLGDFVQEGWLVLIADDLNVGANSVSDLLARWCLLLTRIQENGLTLSARKTFICPLTVIILGWLWKEGKLSPCPHKISALVAVSPPKTCTAMRSFIGAFKAISRCIPKYASLISPLEDAIKGLDGKDFVTWTPELSSSFEGVQTSLKSPSILTIPVRTDHLLLTVDAAVVNKGLGGTLFVQREEKRLLAEFYSFKLKGHQLSWFPCELEALAISAAINHFGPYIHDSDHHIQVLTDSKPCVQAFQRLCKGEFSASARVSTFLSTLSSYPVVVAHLPGKANFSSDYSSRHPVECNAEGCQICKFVELTANSVVVNAITVTDILSGVAPMPYLNKAAWRSAQHACVDLRRVYAHLVHGTRPPKKAKNLANIRRYLNVASVDDHGLIIVHKNEPGVPRRSLIVVPIDVLPGIITALHLTLKHATKHQLKLVFSRYFFAIKSDDAISHVVDHCELCNSLKAVPTEVFEQSLSISPTAPGCVFFADILRRCKQKICVVRDVHSSFTTASIAADETAPTLRAALLTNTAFLRAPNCVVRIDAASGFQALRHDSTLQEKGMKLDFGHVKNKNSNSVVDKGIQELEAELLKSGCSNTPVTSLKLQCALDVLNSRVRNRGLSAKEILFQRDQQTSEQIHFNDLELADKQQNIRIRNHDSSARSKAPGKRVAETHNIQVGDLVFIKDERDKNKARDRYIVVSIEQDRASLQKLVDKFMSKQYTVPLNRVYPASGPAVSLGSPAETNLLPQDEDEESEEDDVDIHTSILPPPHTDIEGADVVRRPQRDRRPPDWYRSKDFRNKDR